MSNTLADAYALPSKSVGRSLWKQFVAIDIGATGAPTIPTGGQSGDITVARTGAGTYDLTFKPCIAAPPPPIAIKSAAKTVIAAIWTAWDPTAGTGTFKTVVGAGTDTDPANGDALGITIEGVPVSAG